MKTRHKILLEHKDGQWQALCLDLCLAAQADTYREVMAKITAMIRGTEPDAIKIRAPLIYWLKYFVARRVHNSHRDCRLKYFP